MVDPKPVKCFDVIMLIFFIISRYDLRKNVDWVDL